MADPLDGAVDESFDCTFLRISFHKSDMYGQDLDPYLQCAFVFVFALFYMSFLPQCCFCWVGMLADSHSVASLRMVMMLMEDLVCD